MENRERQQIKRNTKGSAHVWLDAVGFVQCISLYLRRGKLHIDEAGR